MQFTKKQLCLIWLDGFEGLEYKHKYQILKELGNELCAENVITKCKDYIISNVSEQAYNTIKASATIDFIKHLLNGLQEREVIPITIFSDEYPHSLKEIENPPLVLYAKGDVSLLNGRLFAMVGSRKSLPISLAAAKDYATTLSQSGFTLVTGIAEGVDETVIKSTMEIGGKAISVIAGGIDNVYPKTNVSLIEKLSKTGLVISEQPPEFISKPYMYPIRNRIIAGLAEGVLVVSAGKKSGTLYTAQFAGEYGKDLFAIPYGIGVLSGAGCNELIKRGATLTDVPQDIIEYYGLTDDREKREYSTEEQAIINVLKEGGMHIEKIARAVNKQTFEIIPLLSTLEIEGVIVKSANTYQLTHTITED